MNVNRCLRRPVVPLALLAGAVALPAGAAPAAPATQTSSARANPLPSFIVRDSLRSATYDGVSDDLLTAGLGQTGLAGAAPAFLVPDAPSVAELRRNAIYSNYRAIVDVTSAGGYGRFFGPAVNSPYAANDGRVPGFEVLAFSDDGSGRRNVTLMVQVPAHFDPQRPCITTATSSGSRSVYGAISTAEWGLKRGCAVAYTDKGTHSAPHDLAADTVPLIDGTRSPAATAGDDAAVRARLSPARLAAFNAATPDRHAFKHAHSQRNPEADWGLFTRQAVGFAFWVLNDRYGDGGRRHGARPKIRPDNTLVIAGSLSNGGGAAIAAAEGDREGLIDAVVVSEPQVQVPPLPLRIQRGHTLYTRVGRSLYDYTSFANLYAPCAALSAQLAGTPYQAAYAVGFGALAAQRCASLQAKGALSATGTAAQADEALAKIRAHGWEAESVVQLATFAAFETPSAITMAYANAYSRASVADNVCGYSYGGTTAAGQLRPLTAAELAGFFPNGNGVPPGSGMQLINNLSPGGALRDVLSFSPSSGLQDMNADGAFCLRRLHDGRNRESIKLHVGIAETWRNGQLRGRPTLIVQGRDDGLLPVNHTGRAYTALNQLVEQRRSGLSYIEVTNAQHFDGFIGLPAVLPGFDSRYVPLHLYLERAMNLMWAHLTTGAALPPSQVVRTTPRGGTPGAAPALTEANVPPIALRPAAGDRILFGGRTLYVPD